MVRYNIVAMYEPASPQVVAVSLFDSDTGKTFVLFVKLYKNPVEVVAPPEFPDEEKESLSDYITHAIGEMEEDLQSVDLSSRSNVVKSKENPFEDGEVFSPYELIWVKSGRRDVIYAFLPIVGHQGESRYRLVYANNVDPEIYAIAAVSKRISNRVEEIAVYASHR